MCIWLSVAHTIYHQSTLIQVLWSVEDNQRKSLTWDSWWHGKLCFTPLNSYHNTPLLMPRMSIQSQVANGYYVTRKVNISNYNYKHFKDNLITYCSFLLNLNEPLGTKWLIQPPKSLCKPQQNKQTNKQDVLYAWLGGMWAVTTNSKVEERYILGGWVLDELRFLNGPLLLGCENTQLVQDG